MAGDPEHSCAVRLQHVWLYLNGIAVSPKTSPVARPPPRCKSCTYSSQSQQQVQQQASSVIHPGPAGNRNSCRLTCFFARVLV